MAIRTALLSSRNINLDTDFSKYIETVSEPGVIEGFELANSKIGVGKARVPCERTNGETIYALVENFNDVSISGNGYVIISISQNIIDDGSLGNEDGTGIATVEVVQSLPTKNYLELYEISELGLITDKRNMIKKVGELNTAIETLQSQVNDIDERVEALETAGAIDHLEEMEFVGEKYALADTLFKQLTPKLEDCTVDAKVGDVADNTEIHIQRQGSKTASNKLKLKIKSVGSPTTNVVVEIRKGIEVDVSDSEAYWYGDENNIIATGSLASSSFSSSYAEVEFTLDNNFGSTEGELLDVVVYQSAGSGATVNASNYYVLACDETQWSEAFSYVKVNGTTRSRENLMPYCVSDGFISAMLCKSKSDLRLSAKTLYNCPSESNFPDGWNFYSASSGTLQLLLPLNNSFTGKGEIVFSGKFRDSGNGGSFGSISYGGAIKEISHNFFGYSEYTITTSINGTATSVGLSFSKYSSRGWSSSYARATYTQILSGSSSKMSLKPRELKNIGEKATATSFGEHIDGSFYNELPNNLKLNNDYYDATGYDITSFKGYIKVKINGYYYNIPITNRTNA